MATTAAVVDPRTSQNRIRRLTHQSSLREKVFESLLLGQLGIELLERGIDYAVLHSMSDRDGYDVVIEHGPIIRHIQLKTTITGTATREVPINTRLAARPSGCVIWMVFDSDSRALVEFRWFGGQPGAPLPNLGDRAVRHSRANRNGVKAIRPGIRALKLNQFERLVTIGSLADRLFGMVGNDRPAQRGDWKALPRPEQRESFDLPMHFTLEEQARIRRGLIPQGGDDRWFLFVEDDQLYCHRSWTGECIFGARLEAGAVGTRLTDCWVSRDAEAFETSGIDADRAEFRDLLLSHLILREA